MLLFSPFDDCDFYGAISAGRQRCRKDVVLQGDDALTLKSEPDFVYRAGDVHGKNRRDIRSAMAPCGPKRKTAVSVAMTQQRLMMLIGKRLSFLFLEPTGDRRRYCTRIARRSETLLPLFEVRVGAHLLFAAVSQIRSDEHAEGDGKNDH